MGIIILRTPVREFLLRRLTGGEPTYACTAAGLLTRQSSFRFRDVFLVMFFCIGTLAHTTRVFHRVNSLESAGKVFDRLQSHKVRSYILGTTFLSWNLWPGFQIFVQFSYPGFFLNRLAHGKCVCDESTDTVCIAFTEGAFPVCVSGSLLFNNFVRNRLERAAGFCTV